MFCRDDARHHRAQCLRHREQSCRKGLRAQAQGLVSQSVPDSPHSPLREAIGRDTSICEMLAIPGDNDETRLSDRSNSRMIRQVATRYTRDSTPDRGFGGAGHKGTRSGSQPQRLGDLISDHCRPAHRMRRRCRVAVGPKVTFSLAAEDASRYLCLLPRDNENG